MIMPSPNPENIARNPKVDVVVEVLPELVVAESCGLLEAQVSGGIYVGTECRES